MDLPDNDAVKSLMLRALLTEIVWSLWPFTAFHIERQEISSFGSSLVAHW
jgi:hypothetical protein